MQAVISFFIELCLLRTTPQRLPAAPVLLGLTLAANLLVGALMIQRTRGSFLAALIESLADTGLALGVLQLGLVAVKRRERFLQAGTAILGAGTLLGVVGLLLLSIHIPINEPSDLADFLSVLWLLLLAWNILVLAHILRHTFDLKFGSGLGLAVLYTLLSVLINGLLFPLN